MFRLRIEPEIRREREHHVQRRVRATTATTRQAPRESRRSGFSRPRPRRRFGFDRSSGVSVKHPRAAWRHEIDRANAQVHVRRADLTIGRQAIGWGRGVMFTSVDLFAPFSPLEVDREWRSGVDAVRADIKLTDRSSIDLVGAFGGHAGSTRPSRHAPEGMPARLTSRWWAGGARRTCLRGVTTSAAVGDAEVHAEAAVFRVPSDAAPDDFIRCGRSLSAGRIGCRSGRASWRTPSITTPALGPRRPEDIRALRRDTVVRRSGSSAATCRSSPDTPSA